MRLKKFVKDLLDIQKQGDEEGNEWTNQDFLCEIADLTLKYKITSDELKKAIDYAKWLDELEYSFERFVLVILEEIKQEENTKPTAREVLEKRDMLGVNETFEARIRGALSPYNTLISMLSDDRFDLTDPETLKLVQKSISNNKECLDKILELLKYSEMDREEIKQK